MWQTISSQVISLFYDLGDLAFTQAETGKGSSVPTSDPAAQVGLVTDGDCAF